MPGVCVEKYLWEKYARKRYAFYILRLSSRETPHELTGDYKFWDGDVTSRHLFLYENPSENLSKLRAAFYVYVSIRSGVENIVRNSYNLLVACLYIYTDLSIIIQFYRLVLLSELHAIIFFAFRSSKN